jgi:hypothetical protein
MKRKEDGHIICSNEDFQQQERYNEEVLRKYGIQIPSSQEK